MIKRPGRIKLLSKRDTKLLSRILFGPKERIIWRDWISYWKGVRMVSNWNSMTDRENAWSGSYLNRGYHARRMSLQTRIEL
jgi:hypothetical protein